MGKRAVILSIIFIITLILFLGGVIWLKFSSSNHSSEQSSSCNLPAGAEPGTTIIRTKDGSCVIVPPPTPVPQSK